MYRRSRTRCMRGRRTLHTFYTEPKKKQALEECVYVELNANKTTTWRSVLARLFLVRCGRANNKNSRTANEICICAMYALCAANTGQRAHLIINLPAIPCIL